VVDAQRQEARSALYLLQADGPLRGLDGDLPHRLLHLDDHSGHDERDQAEDDERDVVGEPAAGSTGAEHSRHALGAAADDAGEDDQRHAVADAVLRDELTEPHQHDGAGGQDQHDLQALEPVKRTQDWRAGVLEQHRESICLPGSESDSEVAAPSRDTSTPRLALFGDLLDPLGDHRHQLHDDRGVDIGIHAHGDDAESRQAAAREQVQKAQQGLALEQLGQGGLARAGDRDVGEEPEYDEDPACEQELVAKLGQADGVDQRLE
jgi:hypothetical protein